MLSGLPWQPKTLTALHPPQGCGWRTCSSIPAQHILKIQSLQRPETETIRMEYLAVWAEWCCSWRQLLLRFLALFELLRLVWVLTDSFWQFEELAKVVQQAEVEIYWRKAQSYTACSFELPSHTFTSCFKILSNVWVNNLLQHTYWTVMPMDSVGTV